MPWKRQSRTRWPNVPEERGCSGGTRGAPTPDPESHSPVRAHFRASSDGVSGVVSVDVGCVVVMISLSFCRVLCFVIGM